MDTETGRDLVAGLIPANYARQGAEALSKRHRLVTSLLSERRLPRSGWDAASIEQLVQVCKTRNDEMKLSREHALLF